MPSIPQSELHRRPDFLLVLPAYRELERLPAYLSSLTAALASAPFTTTVEVVDDGSPQDEQQALRARIVPGRDGQCLVLPPRLLPLNRLKGGAVLEGWRSHDALWLAFADADGATSAGELLRVFGEIFGRDPSQREAYFAVRQSRGPKRVRRTAMRRLLSAAFSRLAGIALRTEPMDFQCGFKVIPGRILPGISDKLENRGLCFDLALFMALRLEGVPVRPMPVDWKDQPGGNVSPWKNGPGMIAGLWTLALHGLKTRPPR